MPVVNGTLPGIPTEFFDLDFIGSTVSFALASQKANPINFSGLLRARRERPRRRRAAEQRDELASLQLVELHSISISQRRMQDIELAMVSQRVYDHALARARAR
jgi:hypothetical protein